MLQYERFEKIIDMLRQQPSVRVTDLVPILDASESTIRRDIAELDKEGRLRKVFGGAVALEANGRETAVTARLALMLRAKSTCSTRISMQKQRSAWTKKQK